MGAFLRVKTTYIAFGELKKLLPDLQVLVATLDGTDLFGKELPRQGLLVIGNEGAGISEGITKQATHRITIPKSNQGGAESLNAAVATGILCAVLRN